MKSGGVYYRSAMSRGRKYLTYLRISLLVEGRMFERVLRGEDIEFLPEDEEEFVNLRRQMAVT